jgi:hypothetical protein
LAARVAALQDQDLPPTEQEAADRLLSELNAEIKALNASNAFQSAVTSHLARLEETRKAGGQHNMIEAEIAGWRALLLDAAENEGRETNTTGLVRWQAAIYENAEEIIEMYPSLSARNLMTWCKKHGPRDVFGVAQPNQDTLGWIDSAKKPQTVSYKRVSNLLTDARNAGIFPSKK